MSAISRVSSSLQVAIIGYGLAGSVFHAPIIASVPGLHVAAIVTRKPERQRLARHRYPGASMYSSFEECLADTALDIVVVATPNMTHVEIGQAALEAGKHVVIEKPLAPRVAEAQSLIEAANQRGKLLTIFHNRRWDGDFLTVRQLIEAGMLGQVYSFESSFESYQMPSLAEAWYEQEAQAGGSLYNLGSHLIDQTLLLFGTVDSVYAEMDVRRPNGTGDDVTFVALTFLNGVRAKLYINDVARISGPRFRVRGLLGAFEKYGRDPQEDASAAGMRPGNQNWGRDSPETWGHLVSNINGLLLDGTIETLPGCYQCFYEELRDAVLGNGKVPVDPLDAIASLRIIEAAQQSAKNREVVRLAN